MKPRINDYIRAERQRRLSTFKVIHLSQHIAKKKEKAIVEEVKAEIKKFICSQWAHLVFWSGVFTGLYFIVEGLT